MQAEQAGHAGCTIGPIKRTKVARFIGDNHQFADWTCQPIQSEPFRRLADHAAPFQQPGMCETRMPRDAAQRKRARVSIARRG